MSKDPVAGTDCLERNQDTVHAYLAVRRLELDRIASRHLGRGRLVLGERLRSLVAHLGLGMGLGRVGNRLLLGDRIGRIAVVIDRVVAGRRLAAVVGIDLVLGAVGGSLGRGMLERRSLRTGRESHRIVGFRIDRMGRTF